MFTGLIEAVGRIVAASDAGHSRRFEIRAPSLSELWSGDSVAVDGICLTVTARLADGFRVEAVEATLARTTADEWKPGRSVNLERALRVGDRLGGHFVQGHIDATGRVVGLEHTDGETLLDLDLPRIVADVTVLHGSIAVDGISLTISDLADDVARIALIPHTWSHTNLSRLQPGSRVNLEGDLIGKFVVAKLQRFG